MTRLKVSLEAAQGLAEYWGFREAMEGRSKHDAEGPQSSVGVVSGALLAHLNQHADSQFCLTPVCRTCARLGKVVVLRYCLAIGHI